MRVAARRDIAAPLDEVFDAFSDVRRIAERIPQITKVDVLTSGPIGEGTRWRETRMVMKKAATEEMWFSDFQPNKSYTVRGESMGNLFLTTFRFTEQGGKVRVTAEMLATPQTFKAKMTAPLMLLMKGVLRKCLMGDMEALARLLEGGSASTAAAAGQPT